MSYPSKIEELIAERDKLKEINAELRDALGGMLAVFAKPYNETLWEIHAARAAIAKAKE